MACTGEATGTNACSKRRWCRCCGNLSPRYRRNVLLDVTECIRSRPSAHCPLISSPVSCLRHTHYSSNSARASTTRYAFLPPPDFKMTLEPSIHYSLIRCSQTICSALAENELASKIIRIWSTLTYMVCRATHHLSPSVQGGEVRLPS